MVNSLAKKLDWTSSSLNAGVASLLFLGVNLVSRLYKKEMPPCPTSTETFAFTALFFVLSYLLMKGAEYYAGEPAESTKNWLMAKYSFYGALVFFVLSSKQTFEMISRLYQPAAANGCPYISGIVISTLVFFVVTVLLMMSPRDVSGIYEAYTDQPPTAASAQSVDQQIAALQTKLTNAQNAQKYFANLQQLQNKFNTQRAKFDQLNRKLPTTPSAKRAALKAERDAIASELTKTQSDLKTEMAKQKYYQSQRLTNAQIASYKDQLDRLIAEQQTDSPVIVAAPAKSQKRLQAEARVARAKKDLDAAVKSGVQQRIKVAQMFLAQAQYSLDNLEETPLVTLMSADERPDTTCEQLKTPDDCKKQNNKCVWCNELEKCNDKETNDCPDADR